MAEGSNSRSTVTYPTLEGSVWRPVLQAAQVCDDFFDIFLVDPRLSQDFDRCRYMEKRATNLERQRIQRIKKRTPKLPDE